MRNAQIAVGPLRHVEESLPGNISSVNALGSLWVTRTLDYCAAVTKKGHLEVGVRVFEQQSVLVMLNLPDPVEIAGELRQFDGAVSGRGNLNGVAATECSDFIALFSVQELKL